MSVNTSRNGRFRSSASTHVGAVRNHNEDQFVDRPDLGLWAVADGAGGHDAGDLASARIAELLGSIPANLNAPQVLSEVRNRLAQAHSDLREEAARRGPRAMMQKSRTWFWLVLLAARRAHCRVRLPGLVATAK